MRLICPNCDAQYEVDASVIPEEGRDVQCSNCGHMWFQLPVGAEPADVPATTPDAGLDLPEGPETAPPPVPPAAETLPAEEPLEEPVKWASIGETHPARPEPPGSAESARDRMLPKPPADRSPRTLDPEVANILRGEAARERQAREQDVTAETFADQPDLGLDVPARRSASRMSMAPPAAPAAQAATATRQERLPDIEQINSTLSAATDRTAHPELPPVDEAAERRSGFRRGFGVVLLLAALVAMLYVFAPRIAALHPALEPPMTSYVAAIDKARLWVNETVPTQIERWTRGPSMQGG